MYIKNSVGEPYTTGLLTNVITWYDGPQLSWLKTIQGCTMLAISTIGYDEKLCPMLVTELDGDSKWQFENNKKDLLETIKTGRLWFIALFSEGSYKLYSKSLEDFKEDQLPNSGSYYMNLLTEDQNYDQNKR